ncbi:4-hydroxy-3-methylbut-2-enyl diphosphate reductase [Mangrovibacterium diazotrophicum]|uniref:4-hydroxy-3-methylbut-2-enyl diphosphate reductase n=1 Tax=Mangrovibacterium diazotrophicum TaxID=1261403 RepID=A0A419W7Z9_9BACT|nr:4-hydroxy-3-methylbut-2-enyl diphosphate reductase [Mangrovibacterium diazotrophicum]RKD91482.1 4-hydroxy-3-methylbut-2-enyl diphosphate reductase [Mangrovibacterium diazotrophicum]
MRVVIDDKSGFCFGVVNAIEKAEGLLQQGEKIYCLGDIVHNQQEVARLEALGMVTINHDKYFQLSNCKVLLRAHGEPPATYAYARKNNIELIDGTCPVVLKLQQRVRKGYEDIKAQGGQLVLLGKKGHAEINGLNGQTGNLAIIVETEADIAEINADKPTLVFSQTTKSLDDFHRLGQKIKELVNAETDIKDTICRQVAHRAPHMIEFAAQHEVILFVSGKKSSNGKALFEICKSVNPNSYFISDVDELQSEWIKGKHSVGITGATSTPRWIMEKISNKLTKD